jgi:hypothetical protein
VNAKHAAVNSVNPSASHDEQLAALLAAPPPRRPPPLIRRAAVRQAAPLVFALFGAAFFLFGLFFCSAFFPYKFYHDWQLRAADTARTPGHITDVAPTKMSINKVRVMHYRFEFQPAAGAPVSGDCYTTGIRWRINTPVNVRYRPENPQVACPDGARLSEADATMLVTLIFPVVGAGLFLWVRGARRRAVYLLEHGVVTEAQVMAVEATITRVNNQYVHKITLQRTDGLGDPTIKIRRYQPAVVALVKQRLASKQPVFLLYDPANPKRVLLPEAL